MGLYNFKPRFAPFILSGRKRHTIRATRVHQDLAGDIIHVYTGLRTKTAKLIGRFRCTKTEPITIFKSGAIFIDGQALSAQDAEDLAVRDGFDPVGDRSAHKEMMEFWRGRLPFSGQIVHWEPME